MKRRELEERLRHATLLTLWGPKVDDLPGGMDLGIGAFVKAEPPDDLEVVAGEIRGAHERVAYRDALQRIAKVVEEALGG